jgi:hypothetical protein
MALFPLGILSAAGGGAALIPDYDLLETQILGSTQASITFSSLGTYSSTYKHLQIRASVRTDRANTGDLGRFYFNADETNGNYYSHGLDGTGSIVESFADAAPYITYYSAASATANQFSGMVMDILDPFSTTKNTTTRLLMGPGGSGREIVLQSGLWNNTASITSIKFAAIGSFVTGTRYSLYGIRG